MFNLGRRGDHRHQLGDLVLDLGRRSELRRQLGDLVLDLGRRSELRRQLGDLVLDLDRRAKGSRVDESIESCSEMDRGGSTGCGQA